MIRAFSALMAFLTEEGQLALGNITIHMGKMEFSLSLCLDEPSHCNESAVIKDPACLNILEVRDLGRGCALPHVWKQVHQVDVHNVLQMLNVPAASQKLSLTGLKLSRQGQAMCLKIIRYGF